MPNAADVFGDYKIVSSYNAADLSEEIAKILSKKFSAVELTEFPDGEFKVRLSEDYRNSKILLIHRLYPDASRSVGALLFMLHKLAGNGNIIDILIPYLAFSRQDKEFQNGEVASALALLELLSKNNIGRFTFDIHSAGIASGSGMEVISIPIAALLVKYINNTVKPNSPIAVAPDKGAEQRAAEASKELGCSYICFEKETDRQRDAIFTKAPNADFMGTDAIIIGDIISTGGIIANVSSILKRVWANTVYAACIHYLSLAGTEKGLSGSGADRIFATDTVRSKFSKVGIAKEFVNFFTKDS
ncbi:MAG: ribose-phosphate diphosphokinase [Candidatus Micrarchaeaceae archaeon]